VLLPRRIIGVFAKEQTMSAFKDLLQQAEALLRQATNGSQGQANDLRQNAQDLLEKVKASSQVLQDEAVVKAKQVGEATQNYVKENPWQAVGIAASLGLMLGALMKKDGDASDELAADPKVIEAAPPTLDT
jgi:ElaB/YqjD/DUF883 family membrane-anchored ribosome-binding protein